MLLSNAVWLIHADPKAYLLYASGLLSGMASSQTAVQMAMMVDVIPGELREQVCAQRHIVATQMLHLLINLLP